MNDYAPNQCAVTGPEGSPDDSPTEVEETEIEIDSEDDERHHGPESWREIADTLADPIDPG
jgi:hypothetical protein